MGHCRRIAAFLSTTPRLCVGGAVDPSNREFLKTDAYQCIRHWSRLIVDVVKAGIAAGEFKPDTDPYLLRAVIPGTIERSVISWLLLGRPLNLAELANPLIDLIVQGIQCGNRFSGWNLKIALEPPTATNPLVTIPTVETETTR